MKKLFAPLISIAGFLLAIFFLSNVFPPLMNFLKWWFITKEEINAPITTGQAILIDIITHFITYATVGVLFGFLNWWNSDAMHTGYVVLSEIVSLGLALLLRFILNYYWVMFIILGFIVSAGIVLFIYSNKKNDKREEK